jgi:hypothetical protein
MNGWSRRGERAGPQCGSSRFHIGRTASRGPTIDDGRTLSEIACSANASTAAGVACTGTTLAPAWQADTSSPSSK